jgi:hypothetical protein
MNLALLTGITDCITMTTRLDRELMTMENMANNGCRRMTKARVSLRRRNTNTIEDLVSR